MGKQLTKKDIEKMEQEIEYRKCVVRKEKLEAVKEARARGISVRILNIMQQRKTRMPMSEGSDIWTGLSGLQI